MKPIDKLRELLDSNQFHHATYRCIGTVWEGLWIYRKDSNGFQDYNVVTCINRTDPDLDTAHELVKHAGISVGSYGNG